jgi:hypothetical protein
VAEAIVCGPDADAHFAEIEKYIQVGFDHVYVHQVGKEQDRFFRFYQDEIIPRFNEKYRGKAAAAAA